MSKPKIAFYWCASCGGCEEAVVDLAEDIIKVVDVVDIVFWPVAVDFKKDDIEKLPDGSITASFINGAIRTSEQEEMSVLLRKKSRFIIAFGSCAALGGIPSLANQFEKGEILDYVYKKSPSTVNEKDIIPKHKSKTEDGHEIEIPIFRNHVRALDEVIEVDYYIPGCPPTTNIIINAITLLLKGDLPQKQTILAPDIALCNECPRKDSKPVDLSITEFKRTSNHTPEPEKCLLAQGFLCLGPATRGGCGALCINGNMPCSGCFGPTSSVKDHGAKYLSAIASIINGKTDEEIEKTIQTIPDPLGTFYRYGLSKSLLRGRINRKVYEEEKNESNIFKDNNRSNNKA